MPSPSPVPAREAGSPSRIESARGRVAAARRGIALAAIASFGAGLVLVRASHPATAHGSSASLAAPSSLVAEIQGSPLGGGSIGPASGPSAAATSTS